MASYKIGILGDTFSGKTVYMSTLYCLFYSEAYSNVNISDNSNVRYLVDNWRKIQESGFNWDLITSSNNRFFISGTQGGDQHLMKFSIKNDSEYKNFEFADYSGERYQYDSDFGIENEHIQYLKNCDGIILMVSPRHFDYNTQSVHGALQHSFENIFKTVGAKPCVLIFTQGDVVREELQNTGLNMPPQSYISPLANNFRNKLSKYSGNFSVYLRSSKDVIDTLQNGGIPILRSTIKNSMADLYSPLSELTDIIDKKRDDINRGEAEKLRNKKQEVLQSLNSFETRVNAIKTKAQNSINDILRISDKKKKSEKRLELIQKSNNIQSQILGLSLDNYKNRINQASSFNELNNIISEAKNRIDEYETKNTQLDNVKREISELPEPWFGFLSISIGLILIGSFFF